MVNLLYMAVYGRPAVKETAYRVMTEEPRAVELLPGVGPPHPQPSLRRGAPEPGGA